jgi:DNA-binding transcriptional regulator YiaG
MPNIGSLLKEEITRLSSKEARRHVAALKKHVAQQRRYIAALRRQLGALERALSVLRKDNARAASLADPGAGPTRTRFVAKGLRSHRAKLGLSAGDYGRLVGVSAQTIYSWEAKRSAPREAQRRALAAVRGLGRRAAKARLEKPEVRAGVGTRGSRGRSGRPAK